MKKVTLAVAATLAVATAVPASAGTIDPFEAPVLTAPVVTKGSSISPLLLVGGLLAVGLAVSGDS